jgi:hypothetical protein
VTTFELEPDGWREVRCEHCGAPATVLDGYVHEQRAGTVAAYLGGWTATHHPRQVLVRLLLGPFGDAAAPREAWWSVGLRAFYDGDRIAMMFDEHEAFSAPAVRCLSREEALTHPRVEELWALADAVWEHDARLAPAGHWLLEGVPASLDAS